MSFIVHFRDGSDRSTLGKLTKALDARTAAKTMIDRLNGEGSDFQEVHPSLGTIVYEWRCATGARVWITED